MLDEFSDGKSYLEWLEDQQEKERLGISYGHSSGFPSLDAVIGGFSPGSYTAIGARTSMGKTTLALNFAYNLINQGVGVGFFSFEMGPVPIWSRFISMKTAVPSGRLLRNKVSNEEIDRIRHHHKSIEEWPLYIYDRRPLRCSELTTHIKAFVNNEDVKVVFIDYLTLIKPDRSFDSKHQEVDYVSKHLQWLAKDYNVAVISLAQFNRQIMGRADKRPHLSDFRESGSVEEDLDVALLPSRPAYYNDLEDQTHLDLYVAKNRIFGELAKIQLKFDYDSGRYTELASIQSMMTQVPANDPAFERFSP